MNPQKNDNEVIAIIVIAQFACTSLWFASNAVIADIQQSLGLESGVVGELTSAVQFGFIMGTLVFALLTISDRYSPSRVFFVSAVAGAFANIAIFWAGNISLVLFFRFATGFCLAGIYPVGMKIAADYRGKGLGLALGLLVGALVLGTAFPHLLNSFSANVRWKNVIAATSLCATLGGLAVIIFVPDGPFRRESQKIDFSAFLHVFQVKPFRLAAFGYFGHMWELYAFWAFVPAILMLYQNQNKVEFNLSFWSFLIIALGGLGCALGGVISGKIGNAKVALWALIISGTCCLISPFIYELPFEVFITIVLIWGFAVVADSPQFSTLVAQTAPKETMGTALTIVNSVGFAITIFSIMLINEVLVTWPKLAFVCLVIGPTLGIVAILKFMRLKK